MSAKTKYLKELKNSFVVLGEVERAFLKNLEDELDDHMSYADIIESYGQPQEIAASFLAENEASIIRSKLIKRKYAMIGLLVIFITILLISGYLFSVFHDADQSFINREQTVIEEN